jgi:nucleotide-binding universal stress UspA family protein
MRGTLVCAVTDAEESEHAVALGVELSERLGLRLVLAHAVDGIAAVVNADSNESVTIKQSRQGAERRLSQLAEKHGVAETAERRVAIGEPAVLFGQIAAEEAADVIVVGGRSRGWRRRSLDSELADQLETETPVPVVLARPRIGRRVREPAINGGRR